MFLQETKTKRGGKTYISYLVRESFRTANGPRGRTICNLTHLPKEVRDMVALALKGEPLVPLGRLEVNNIHSFGGCVALEDAARRHALPELLAPLSPHNRALIKAMIFGGLLFAPSAAPFHVECKAARLALFCGLDPEKEHFGLADLAAALRELDERWPQLCAILIRPPAPEVRAITLFRTSHTAGRVEMGALGMDADGIPVPLIAQIPSSLPHALHPGGGSAAEAGLPGFLLQVARQSKNGPPLLTLDQETASRMNVERLKEQPCLIELAPESLAGLLRQLNQAQLLHALREGDLVEVRHHGERYILAPVGEPRIAETQEAPMRMGSLANLKELASMTTPGRHMEIAPTSRAGHGGALAAAGFQGLTTNVSTDRLPPAAAMEWTNRARAARAAFAPVQILTGQPALAEEAMSWRNHQNLQFLTHRLRCHLNAEWRARGEKRPVEEVLRELQEVHRVTLTVDGAIVRRLASHPSKAVAALLTKLDLWSLFQSVENGRTAPPS